MIKIIFYFKRIYYFCNDKSETAVILLIKVNFCKPKCYENQYLLGKTVNVFDFNIY